VALEAEAGGHFLLDVRVDGPGDGLAGFQGLLYVPEGLDG
jgi:hypothetical protein